MTKEWCLCIIHNYTMYLILVLVNREISTASVPALQQPTVQTAALQLCAANVPGFAALSPSLSRIIHV